MSSLRCLFLHRIVVSSEATLPSPDTCDPVGMVITVASAELAPVNDPGDDWDIAPPGAVKENCSLLFHPELDFAGQMSTIFTLGLFQARNLRAATADNLRVDINLVTGKVYKAILCSIQNQKDMRPFSSNRGTWAK